MTQNSTLRADRARLSASDWEQAALDVIAESGVNAVAVEPLARRLGVTKGSFYWHFQNRQALLQAALDLWERDALDRMVALVESIDEPRERLREVFRLSARGQRAQAIYAQLFAAADDPQVAPALERVSMRVLRFLAGAFKDLGMGAEEAARRGRLAYAAYLGFLHLSRRLHAPKISDVEYEASVQHVMDTLIP